MADVCLYLGSALVVLRKLPDASVDAVVTDPPAGIAFMGKDWDDFRRSRNPDDVGRDNAFGRLSATAPEIGRRRYLSPTADWQAPVTQHGFTDGAARLSTPSIGGSRNPVCGRCHKHKRGHAGSPGCSCASPDFDQGVKWIETRQAFVSWLTEIMRECLRVLKPGGHALIWSIPRTSHWTTTAIEDAGFEIRDSIAHLFGTGFGGKGCSVGKAIDKLRGAKREVVGVEDRRGVYDGRERSSVAVNSHYRTLEGRGDDRDVSTRKLTCPATPEAAVWEGWNTTLAPAREDWILARKPLAAPTVAEQVLATGTGAINIAATRIEIAGSREGRWPKHVLLSHAPECVCVGTARVRGSRIDKPCKSQDMESGYKGGFGGPRPARGIGDAEGMEEVEVFACVPSCPIRRLDDQAGIRKSGKMRGGTQRSQDGGYRGAWPGCATQADTYGDAGGVSRFFPIFYYASKAPPSERHHGCNGLFWRSAPDRPSGYVRIDQAEYDRLGVEEETAKAARKPKRLRAAGNMHATVKNLDLMRWLCRLITPPGGVVLDVFMGSGSTGVAALQEGFDFIGIERDPDYMTIARSRLEATEGNEDAATTTTGCEGQPPADAAG